MALRTLNEIFLNLCNAVSGAFKSLNVLIAQSARAFRLVVSAPRPVQAALSSKLRLF